MKVAGELAGALRALDGGRLLVVTGAGISLASGIPTFRGSDPHAIWKRDVTELGTRRYFEEDPVGSWCWYVQRFEAIGEARPNPAHAAVARIERWHAGRGGDFLLVTQNIDTLHEQAGSIRLVKVHGSIDRVRCSRSGCVNGTPRGSLPRSGLDLAPLRADPSRAHLPECPECGAILRPHVLWFDEYYDEHDDY
ncbi:MAG: SIR2 family NAD-dependent protein deacylase, partial [Planctomycetota bacterium]